MDDIADFEKKGSVRKNLRKRKSSRDKKKCTNKTSNLVKKFRFGGKEECLILTDLQWLCWGKRCKRENSIYFCYFQCWFLDWKSEGSETSSFRWFSYMFQCQHKRVKPNPKQLTVSVYFCLIIGKQKKKKSALIQLTEKQN